MSISILLAESDKLYRNLIKDVLEEEGYTVYDTYDGETVVDLFSDHQEISLAFIDVKLHNADGMKLLEEIRKKSDIPVIMLIEHGDYACELSAFRSGANDCISKPLNCDILVERTRNMLRLTNADKFNTEEYGILALNRSTRKVCVNGTEKVLSKKEYKLLLLLVDNENHVLAREQMLNELWEKDFEGGIRAVDTYIKLLRLKLDEAGKYVRTIRGKGYSFVVI